jgi:hypothetical protein
MTEGQINGWPAPTDERRLLRLEVLNLQRILTDVLEQLLLDETNALQALRAGHGYQPGTLVQLRRLPPAGGCP